MQKQQAEKASHIQIQKLMFHAENYCFFLPQLGLEPNCTPSWGDTPFTKLKILVFVQFQLKFP